MSKTFLKFLGKKSFDYCLLLLYGFPFRWFTTCPCTWNTKEIKSMRDRSISKLLHEENSAVVVADSDNDTSAMPKP